VEKTITAVEAKALQKAVRAKVSKWKIENEGWDTQEPFFNGYIRPQ
jgi:hypothetical protein